MKNLQKGFIVYLLVLIVAVLAIGGGIYVYMKSKANTDVAPPLHKINPSTGNSVSSDISTNTSDGNLSSSTEFKIKIPKPNTNSVSVPTHTSIPTPIPNKTVPVPTLTFSAAGTNISYNSATALIWEAQNVNTCLASSSWSGTKAPSGSQNTGNLTHSQTYTLVCTGAGGSVTKSVTIMVGAAPDITTTPIVPDTISPTVTITTPTAQTCPTSTTRPGDANCDGKIDFNDYYRINQCFLKQPNCTDGTPNGVNWANGDFNKDGKINFDDYSIINNAFLNQPKTTVPTPTLTFSIASTSISYDTATTLTWSSQNATACTASGAWTGSQSLAGSQGTGDLTSSKTYTLVCTNSVVTVSETVTVNVAAAPPGTNYLESAVVSQFNALIAGKTPPSFAGSPPYAQSSVNIFNPDGSRNSQLWTGNIDLTCIPQSVGRNGVLITKRDMIFANHYGYSNPTFVDNSGNLVSRTVVSARPISNLVGDADILVATLDEDVPASITPCALAPSTIRSYSPSPGPTYSYYYPVVFTNQDRTLLIGELRGIDTSIFITRSSDANFTNWYYYLRSYDSGAPAFLLVNGSLALLTNWHSAGSGPVDADNISEINAAITANGSPYAVSTFDLSSFTTY